jgi:thiol-disulfide isomerase/thioredoxin
MRKTILLFFLFFLPFNGQAAIQPWTTQDAQGQTEVHLYLFWSLTCPHCLTARPQILELVSQHGWIRLHDHELSENPAMSSVLLNWQSRSARKRRPYRR